MIPNAYRNGQRDDHVDPKLFGVRAEREVARTRAIDLTPTPLVGLEDIAAALGIADVRIKDESDRVGLGSFKALGGWYAVDTTLCRVASQTLGRPVAANDLRPGGFAHDLAASITFTCASAGNHGLAVAFGAQQSGARAVIWLGADVPDIFEQRLLALGATVHRVAGDYRESESAAVEAADQNGWYLMADSSWEGYVERPLEVMRGYTTLIAEAIDQWELEDTEPATHIFVQAGVGGLAAAVAGYLRDRWGGAPLVIVVEPDRARCLQASAAAGRLVTVEEGVSNLGRLDCPVPSMLAFDVLLHSADIFLTISDTDAVNAAQALAPHVQLSACGAAGAAGLLSAYDPRMRSELALHADSRVLLIGTERHLTEG